MMQMTFNQISQSAGYKADDVSVSITCCGGSYGGGSEVLVVEEAVSYLHISDEDVCFTLRSQVGGACQW